MSLVAFTRDVSPTIGECALTYLERQSIDVGRARAQHRAYEECLRSLGVRVIALPVEPELPDAVFVEDTVVVVDEVAVMTRPLLPSRQAEVQSMAAALSPYRPLRFLMAPAHLEGGDVVRIDRTLYIGLSRRTNQAGVDQLRGFLAEFGYNVHPVELDGCLHLKTGCSYLGRDTLLADRSCVDTAQFGVHEVIEAPAGGMGGNVLRIGETIVVPASQPEIATALNERGFEVVNVDVSELEKAEAGLTCCSVVFEAGTGKRSANG